MLGNICFCAEFFKILAESHALENATPKIFTPREEIALIKCWSVWSRAKTGAEKGISNNPNKNSSGSVENQLQIE